MSGISPDVLIVKNGHKLLASDIRALLSHIAAMKAGQEAMMLKLTSYVLSARYTEGRGLEVLDWGAPEILAAFNATQVK